YEIDETSPFHWQQDVKNTVYHLQDKKIDWLIIDHYTIDSKWEEQVAKYVKRIFVIDDLANRKHNCHVLLDQNYYTYMKERYNQLVPISTKLLLGPTFCLLRPEFSSYREHMKINKKKR